jgi:hypothetical protein
MRWFGAAASRSGAGRERFRAELAAGVGRVAAGSRLASFLGSWFLALRWAGLGAVRGCGVRVAVVPLGVAAEALSVCLPACIPWRCMRLGGCLFGWRCGLRLESSTSLGEPRSRLYWASMRWFGAAASRSGAGRERFRAELAAGVGLVAAGSRLVSFLGSWFLALRSAGLGAVRPCGVRVAACCWARRLCDIRA